MGRIRWDDFATEADLCAAAIKVAQRAECRVFAELLGWDFVLEELAGVRVGVEAKLRPTNHAFAQTIARMRLDPRPDHAAILLPGYAGHSQSIDDFESLARELGISLWYVHANGTWSRLPRPWARWHRDRFADARTFARLEPPAEELQTRLEEAGRPSPRVFTEWRRRALAVALRLERGPVTSADFAALKINPRLWIDRGWIVPIGKDGRRTLYAAGDPLPADFPARGWGRELAAMRRAARSSLV